MVGLCSTLSRWDLGRNRNGKGRRVRLGCGHELGRICERTDWSLVRCGHDHLELRLPSEHGLRAGGGNFRTKVPGMHGAVNSLEGA